MRLPDPIANTTTEAYLAYKAGVLAQGDLKPKLYEPYIHLDAWLAYWTGLTKEYPVKNVGKNLFNVATAIDNHWLNYQTGKLINDSNPNVVSDFIAVQANQPYTISGADSLRIDVWQYASKDENTGKARIVLLANQSHSFTPTTGWIRFAVGSGDAIAVKDGFMLEKGSTATSFEPYSGEPEMLTDEEAYIAYLSGVTNTYPEEFRDPADIRVAAYLRYLISARWGRPEYPVNNEEFYLSLMKTKFIPSGDPSSDIEIDGTAKAAFVDVKMYGDTFQQSYTGKNLVKPVATAGVTASYNEATGEYSVSKATAASWLWLTGHCPLSQTITSGTTITISRNVGSSFNFWVRTYHPDNTYGSYSLGTTKLSQVVTEEKDINRIVVMANATPDNFSYSFKLQVEIGNEATSFEPYVGGTPSPNPDYPQPVQTVTGLQTVTVVGKNLLDMSQTWVRGTLNNSSVEVQPNDNTILSDYIKVEPNTTYVFSQKQLGGKEVKPNVVSFFKDKINARTGFVVILTSSPQAFTTSNDTYYIRVGYYNSTGLTLDTWLNYVTDLQLEVGSTATAYAPYHATSYPINLGKNLFDKNNYSDQTGYYIGSNGIWRSGGASDHYFVFRVEPNTTYTFSKNAQASNNRFRVGISSGEPTVGVAFPIWGGGDTATEITLTTASDSKYAYVYYSVTVNVEEAIQSLQIEVGGQKTSYAPYFTPIELCKLGDSQDYIWEDDGEWKIRKAVNTYLFDGSTKDGYTFNADLANTLAVNLNPDKKDQVAFKYLSADVKSCMAASLRFVWGVNDAEHIYVTGAQEVSEGYNGNIRLYILKSRLDGYSASLTNTQKAQLVADWLASNPMKVYYIPKNRVTTDTVITNQALIGQLNALKNGGAENGTTYIKVNATDPNLPGLLYVEAPKYD